MGFFVASLLPVGASRMTGVFKGFFPDRSGQAVAIRMTDREGIDCCIFHGILRSQAPSE